MNKKFIVAENGETAVAKNQILSFRVDVLRVGSSGAPDKWYLEANLLNKQGTFIISYYATEQMAKDAMAGYIEDSSNV